MASRIGVVGVGVHGMHHVRVLSTISDIAFAGFYDSNVSVRDAVVAETGAVPFDNLDALLDVVDCVSVAVPTSSHHDTVCYCLDAGKHVFVEKPISSSIDEADDMIARAKAAGCVLAVGHIERYNAAYRSIESIGLEPLFIEAHRLAVFNPRGTDVAVVLDLMIHDIDVLLSLVRSPVSSVDAVGVAVVTDEIDIANARIKFENGCVANLTTSRISQKKMRKTRIFQKNAYVSMDFLTGSSEVFSLASSGKPVAGPGDLPQLMNGISYKQYMNDGANALQLELHDFLQAVETGSFPRVTADDGRAALDVAIRVMDSMAGNLRSIV